MVTEDFVKQESNHGEALAETALDGISLGKSSGGKRK